MDQYYNVLLNLHNFNKVWNDMKVGKDRVYMFGWTAFHMLRLFVIFIFYFSWGHRWCWEPDFLSVSGSQGRHSVFRPGTLQPNRHLRLKESRYLERLEPLDCRVDTWHWQVTYWFVWFEAQRAQLNAKEGAQAVFRLDAQTLLRLYGRQHQTLRPMARLAAESPENTRPGTTKR